MSSGIYKITIGRWFYYGQTINFDRRRKEHIRNLKKGKHENVLLQRAFDKHKTFEFSECAYENNTDLLTELEQLVIDEWFGKPNCANLNPEAAVPPSTKGKKLGPRSEETIAKIRAARKDQPGKPRSEETRAKMSASHKGISLTEEQKAKISAANKGRKRSEETRAKIKDSLKLYHERKRQENLE